ncbi:MAG: hypothetical protein NVSMB46_05720 [Candidatus Saccharimonadales bacterium]
MNHEKKLDKKLQSAHADALFLSIGEGAIATDEKGKIERINSTALNILGYTEQEVIGKWFPKICIATDEAGKAIPTIERPITQAFLTGHTVSQKTFYLTKQGTIVPIALTVSPILINDTPIGAIEVFRDISIEHEVDKMKSDFISIASHQLRTPLSAIQTYANMLIGGYQGELKPDQLDFMKIIISSVDRMNELINTLLDITRIETGKMTVVPESICLQSIISEIMTELEPSIKNKNLVLSTLISKKAIDTMTDKLLIKEAYTNLVTNAIKYTPAKGKIKISLTRKTGHAIFSVKDSGYGIPSELQDRIFSKFFRAQNILKKDTTGTGLGLYMVKAIATALDGDITFKSVQDKGSDFYFSIPIIN